jgi:hypothetical protein
LFDLNEENAMTTDSATKPADPSTTLPVIHDHAPHPQPIQHHTSSSPPLSAPEIDWALCAPALAVLLIVLAILAGRRRTRKPDVDGDGRDSMSVPH